MTEEEYEREIASKDDKIKELEDQIDDMKSAFSKIQDELTYIQRSTDDADRIIQKFI